MAVDGREVPLFFGIRNHIPDAILSASPEPDAATPLSQIKNEWRARQTVWNDLTRDIVIEFRLPDVRLVDFVALPQSTLIGLDQVRMDLFSDDDLQVLAYETESAYLAEPRAVGIDYRAGIDGFGAAVDEDKPDVFVRWLPESVPCRSGRLVIRRSDYTKGLDEIALRMLVIGERLKLSRNFEYGITLRRLTDPDLRTTSSGMTVENRPQLRSRAMALRFPMMSDADHSALARMTLSLRGQPFIVSAYPGRTGWQYDDYTFLGRFRDALDFAHVFEDIHSVDAVILES